MSKQSQSSSASVRKISRTKKIILWVVGASLITIVLGVMFWIRTFRSYTPVEVMQDVRAGIAARNVAQPDQRVERFLETRYGPLTDPANRQKAFLDFFNVDHVKGLHFIVSHTPEEQKKANNQAMAQWIANYRRTMLPEEKAALKASLDSDAGHAMVQKASAQYLQQDVHYRGETAIVITELMTTLDAIRSH